jgi:hypothetical protein
MEINVKTGLREKGSQVWTGFIWRMTGTNWWVLVIKVMNVHIP